MLVTIFSNVNGDFELLEKIMKNDPEITWGFSMGNLPLACKSTPIDNFHKPEFREEGEKAKDFFSTRVVLPKFTYSIYGNSDDCGIPDDENAGANLLIVKHFQMLELVAWATRLMQGFMIPTTKVVRLGMLGGYYSQELWGEINEERVRGNRNKKALALCESDFHPFNNRLLDFLVTFESPHKYDNSEKILPCGCKQITELVMRSNAKVHFHAHERKFSNGYIGDTLSVGVPPLKDGYIVFNLYNSTMELRDISGRPIQSLFNVKK